MWCRTVGRRLPGAVVFTSEHVILLATDNRCIVTTFRWTSLNLATSSAAAEAFIRPNPPTKRPKVSPKEFCLFKIFHINLIHWFPSNTYSKVGQLPSTGLLPPPGHLPLSSAPRSSAPQARAPQVTGPPRSTAPPVKRPSPQQHTMHSKLHSVCVFYCVSVFVSVCVLF